MSILFEPVQIGNLTVKNRFMRSATYFALADGDGFVNEANVDLIRTLAENEVGLIIPGYAYVLKGGQRSPGVNGIQDDEHIHGYQKMTRAAHDADAKIVLQIAHTGFYAMRAAQTGGEYLTVSQIEDMPDFGRKPREMNEEDIIKIIDAFGQAARRVEEAGFDGVQLHGAHCYLISQFLSPHTNKRNDRWGGSLENRMRFVIEVTRKIKQQVSADFPIMIKLGCRDYIDSDDAMTISDGIRIVQALQKEGMCLVELSWNVIDAAHRRTFFFITSSEKEAVLLSDARKIREATSVPLALVTGMRSLPVMEDVIRSGVADLISISRPLIREPGLIKRWKQGDTRPAECISCLGDSHGSQYGCFNMDESGKMHIFCRQLKKQE